MGGVDSRLNAGCRGATCRFVMGHGGGPRRPDLTPHVLADRCARGLEEGGEVDIRDRRLAPACIYVGDVPRDGTDRHEPEHQHDG